MRIFLGTAFFLGGLSTVAFALGAGPAPRQDSRDELIASARDAWESLDSFQATQRWRVLDGRGNAEKVGDQMEVVMAWARGARRYFRARTFDAAGQVTYDRWIIEDGKYQHNLETSEHDRSALDAMMIYPQTNTDEKYRGSMSEFLWLWTPTGLPLFRVLERATSVETGEGGEVILKTDKDGYDVTIVLDPAHDYLPRSVEVNRGIHVFTVEEFRRTDDGRWYPARGHYVRQPTDMPYRRVAFEVTDFRTNDPSTEALFKLQRRPRGMIVADYTPAGRSGIVGGIEARQRLEAERLGLAKATAKPAIAESVASSQDEGFPWGLCVAGLGLIGLAVAWRTARAA